MTAKYAMVYSNEPHFFHQGSELSMKIVRLGEDAEPFDFSPYKYLETRENGMEVFVPVEDWDYYMKPILAKQKWETLPPEEKKVIEDEVARLDIEFLREQFKDYEKGLSLEDFIRLYVKPQITDDVLKVFGLLHNKHIDIAKEIQDIGKQEYEFYVKGTR